MPNERRGSTRMEATRLGQLSDHAVTAYLGLGSNLGDRNASLREAIARLSDPEDLTVVAASSIYETAPWGYTNQPDFLNCVVEVETQLSPVDLLGRVEKVQREMGRTPTWRYGPRLIDVDILLYGDLCLQLCEPDLVIPHPRMDQRAFVLIPLAEIAGGILHPVLHRTINDLASEVGEREGVRVWAARQQLSDLVSCDGHHFAKREQPDQQGT